MAIIRDTIKEFGQQKLKEASTGFLTGALGGTLGGAIAKGLGGEPGAKSSGTQSAEGTDPVKNIVIAVRDLQSDLNSQSVTQKQIAGALQAQNLTLSGISDTMSRVDRTLRQISDKLDKRSSLLPDINLGGPGGGAGAGRGNRVPTGGAGRMGRLAGAGLGAVGAGLEGYNEYQESGSLGRAAAVGGGTFAGGWAGAKLGMAAGAFGGPIGAAIGGLLGGVGGAYLGSSATKGLLGPSGQSPAMAELAKKEELQKSKAAAEIEREAITYNSKQIVFKADSIKFETTGGGSSAAASGMSSAPSSTPSSTGPGPGPGGSSGPGGPGGSTGPGGMTTLKTSTGKSYTVASQYAENFKGFVDELEASGYKINSIGGYANRTTAKGGFSYHSKGMAIDINPDQNPHTFPRDRNYGQTNMPANVGAMAAKYGLGWGGNWNSSKDTMHFSMGGSEGGSGGSGGASQQQMAIGEGEGRQGGGAGAGGGVTRSSAVPAGAAAPVTPGAGRMGGPGGGASGSQQEYYNKMYNSLLAAAKEKGVPNPEVLAHLGATQTSLETGYGRRMVGNNAFGIKAGRGMDGVTAATSEFIGGRMVGMNQRFRRYGDVTESAGDYIDLMRNDPRYRRVLASGNIDEAIAAQARSGYATDPEYGAKLASIQRRLGGGVGAAGAAPAGGEQFGPFLPEGGMPKEKMADLTGGMDIAGGGAMVAGAASATSGSVTPAAAAMFQNMGKSSEFANQKLGGAPVKKPKAAATAPGVRSGPSQDEVRKLWERYNETGHPADFVRADNAMKAMQAAQDAAPAAAGKATGGRGKAKPGKAADLGPASMYGESDSEYRSRIAAQEAAAAEGAPGYEGKAGKILTHAQKQVADLEAERNRRLAEEESIDDADRIRAAGERGKLVQDAEIAQKADAGMSLAQMRQGGSGAAMTLRNARLGRAISPEEQRERQAEIAAAGKATPGAEMTGEMVDGVSGFDAAAWSKAYQLQRAPDTASGAAMGFGEGGADLNRITDGQAAMRMSADLDAYKMQQFEKTTNPAAAFGFEDQPPGAGGGAEISSTQTESAVPSSEMLRSAFGEIPNLGYAM